MMLKDTETATGHRIGPTFWSFFAILGLLLSSSNANSFCGLGPHVLKSDPLQIYVLEGQQTIIKIKGLPSQVSVNNVRWWTKSPAAQSLFDSSTTKTNNDTQVTLTMYKGLDGVRIKYQMKYTQSSARKKRFTSAAATLLLGGDTEVALKENYVENMTITALADTHYTVSCFDVKYGTVKSVKLHRKNGSKRCQVPVSNSFYSYGGGCVTMGPLDESHSGDYCVLVENCFSPSKVSISFHLEVQGPPTNGSSNIVVTTSGVVKIIPSTPYAPTESGCGNPNDPNGGMFEVSGRNYYDTADLVCKDGFQLSGSTTSTCLTNGTWSKFGHCIKNDLKKYGVQPKFTISSDDKGIKSPLLIRNQYRTHIKFHYELTARNPRIHVQNIIRCFIDLAGKILTERIPQLAVINITGRSGDGCIKLPVDRISRTCRTYRVVTKADVKTGYVTVSDIQFGDSSICSETVQLKTTLECQFDDSDCGITNDACGLVDWELRSEDDPSRRRRRRSTDCFAQKGVPLLKRKLRSTCSFENLNILDLQPSGFSVEDLENYTDSAQSTTYDYRVRRSSGYSIYLDPSKVTGGVAVGVFDLPEVYHDNANAFLSFAYDMVESGLHDLLVTAVCTSDPSNYLVPLDEYSTHYHKSNFDGLGGSGTICLNIHSYVKEEDCSTFVIQMQGAAVETVLIVDNVFFSKNLVNTPCGTTSNSRK